MESIFWEILDMLPTAVYILNQDGTFRFINKAAEELDALRRDEIIGKQAFQIYQSIYLGEETISPGITALHTGKSIENINLEWYCNGKRNNALTSAYPIVKEGETVGAVIFCDPVSSLKRRLIQNISFMKKSTIKLRHKQLKNGTEYMFDDIMGKSSVMQNTIQVAKRFAGKDMPVMLCGETGTGKELFAQSIHNASNYYAGPFVPVNCAAIPETLLESTLFGTVKGAFTGAVDSVGLFEKAKDGSIFLDEINSMPLLLQAKILRAIQEKEVQRVGDNKFRKISCRIISATNVLPEKLINDKIMRTDLYYRLSTGLIIIPPLRDRGNDLFILMQSLIDKYNAEQNALVIDLIPSLKSMFLTYDWPGNVRELSNILESAFNMLGDNGSYIGFEHIPNYFLEYLKKSVIKNKSVKTAYDMAFKQSADSWELSEYKNLPLLVDNYERTIIESAMEKTRGNLTHCGKLLGISRQSLTVKLKKYKITSGEFR